MDLNDIKEIIKREGGKIVIVENNQPQMVIMSFDEWRGVKKPEQSLSQRAPQEEKVPAPPPIEEKAEELTIDDLPL